MSGVAGMVDLHHHILPEVELLCRRVLIIDRGRIVGQGTHQQLVALGGLYKRMWELQSG